MVGLEYPGEGAIINIKIAGPTTDLLMLADKICIYLNLLFRQDYSDH